MQAHRHRQVVQLARSNLESRLRCGRAIG